MKRASITLTTLIVLSSILLAGGISFILSSVDIRYVSNDSFDRVLLDIHMRTCLEESVYKVTTDNTYTGNFLVTIDEKECSITITNSGLNTKNVAISGTYSNKTSYKNYAIDISDTPYQVAAL